MILSCPSCSAQYFADDSAIGENGRTVRCAACGHSWFAKPELSLEEKFNESNLSRDKVERIRQQDEATPVSPHQAYREKEFAKRQNGARFAALAAWTGSAAAFFALGAGAVIKRDDIVKYWPESSSAYAMVGLETNRYGLEFGPVDAERTFEGTSPVLTLSGTVLNTTDKTQTVPIVRIDLRNDNGVDIDSHTITLENSALKPGEQGRFTTRIDSPPNDAFDIALSFVEPPATPVEKAVHDNMPASHTETEQHHAGDDASHEESVESHDESGHDESSADDHH